VRGRCNAAKAIRPSRAAAQRSKRTAYSAALRARLGGESTALISLDAVGWPSDAEVEGHGRRRRMRRKCARHFVRASTSNVLSARSTVVTPSRLHINLPSAWNAGPETALTNALLQWTLPSSPEAAGRAWSETVIARRDQSVRGCAGTLFRGPGNAPLRRVTL